MSRTIRSTLIRSLALTGTLAAGAMIAAPAARAQSGEQALQNHRAPATRSLSPAYASSGITIDGEPCLLGRLAPRYPRNVTAIELASADTTRSRIDGSRALLGRKEEGSR